MMRVKANPDEAQEYATPVAPQFQDGSLRTLIYASLFIVCCLYLFNKRRKPSAVTDLRPHTLVGDAVAQDGAPTHGTKNLNGGLSCQIDCPDGKVTSLVLLADGKRVVCACKAEKTIQMWNVVEEHGSERKAPTIRDNVAVSVIASSDGGLIVTGDVDGNVVVWDSDLQKRYEAADRRGKTITALDVFSRHIASGSNDGTVVVWEMGEPGFPLVPSPLILHASSISVSSVKFSPSGSRIASVCADWGCTVKIWHARTKHQIASIPIPNGLPTHSLAWSSDGRRLFAGCYGGSISCFDTVTGKPFSKVIESRPGDDLITSLYVSNSDQFLVSFSAPGRTVDIWDVRDTRKPLRSYNRCVSASISPDEVYLASSGTDKKISIRRLSGVVEESYFFHHVSPWITPSEPFTYISPTAYQAWKSGKLEQVEHILSMEIKDKRHLSFHLHLRANRALVRIRRGNLNGALDDAGEAMANVALAPPIAHIAKTMALLVQGKEKEAINTLESIRCGDAKDFVDCVKSIMLFEAELHNKPNCGPELTESLSTTDAICFPWEKARKLFLLAERCLQAGKFTEGLQLLAEVPDLHPFLHVPETKTILLIFGWDILDLECMVHQLSCQALFASGRTQEAMDFLRVNENRLDGENEERKADLGWLSERLGDQAMRRSKFDDAITWYSVAFQLYPDSRVIDSGSEYATKCISAIEADGDSADEVITKYLVLIARYSPGSARLLVKQSKAKASKESWDDALKDADQAIEADKLCPLAYERRYVALRAVHRYREANETLERMITKMGESADPNIRQLRTEYVAPADTIKRIDQEINVFREKSPLVLIHVETGNLCNAGQRIQIFKTDFIFHELVSSMSKEVDIDRIQKVVARFFRYVMFSHTWEGKEPTFQDVSEKSVYELDAHPLKLKLRRFCETVREDPEEYLWAWSDTCCIDKTIETVYRKSIRSMYSWYKESALTIVLLAGGPTALKHNRWMTRAWTLQELLSPKSIRFYDRNWKLYRGDTLPNHKESTDIIGELTEAIDIAQNTLVDFSPKSLSIRAKLRLASTREATEKVDIAYALIGIFDSDLIPEYRDPEDALGLLLQEIVHRERDAKAVLDWVGKSSHFNSCLPAQITAYQNPPYTPSSIPEGVMEARTAELRSLLPQRDVIMLFENFSALGSMDFTHRRLSLPCIKFSVTVHATGHNEASSDSGQTIIYQAHAAALGQFQFQASRTAFAAQKEVVLVYPWIRDLLSHTDRRECDSYAWALRLVVHLEQPFRALLLVKESVDTWKRVGADSEILIPQRNMASLKGISTAVMEIR